MNNNKKLIDEDKFMEIINSTCENPFDPSEEMLNAAVNLSNICKHDHVSKGVCLYCNNKINPFTGEIRL